MIDYYLFEVFSWGLYELGMKYRFQVREEKRERLADLRKKFEEDKARIARMKTQRKFKPF